MNESQLAEFGQFYDEYMFGNRKLPSTQQAIVCFKAVARDIHTAAGGEERTKLNLERYISAIILPEVVQYLDKRQAKHPVVTPEIMKTKSQSE